LQEIEDKASMLEKGLEKKPVVLEKDLEQGCAPLARFAQHDACWLERAFSHCLRRFPACHCLQEIEDEAGMLEKGLEKEAVLLEKGTEQGLRSFGKGLLCCMPLLAGD
jgi:hypothetical protein